MKGIAIFAVINAAFLIFIFLFFRNRIDRRMRSSELLSVVREEISQLIVELNQTTNRNVEIIEERIERLKEITQRADKRIGLLTKEIGNKEKQTEVYTSLKPKSGLQENDRTNEREKEKSLPSDGKTAPEQNSPTKESTGERVIAMYKNGIAPDIIGKELDITLAEVELIISLNRNRGAFG